MAAGALTLDAHPLTPTVGAEVHDVGLTTNAGLARIGPSLPRELAERGVLVFREQHAATPDHQLVLARTLGTPVPSPIGEPPTREVVRIIHDADAPPTENIWHVDHSFQAAPPRATVLRAIEIPTVGGDTLFADMRAVWRDTPERVRDLVRGLRAVHDIAKWAAPERADELRAAAPVTAHPAVVSHPVTGEEILYVNAAYTTGFEGLAEQDATALLDFLLRRVHTPEAQCRVRWAPGTIVLWDNLTVQHYATGDYMPERRVMDRVVVAGDAPQAARPAGDRSSEATLSDAETDAPARLSLADRAGKTP
jgi:taurine dioxygenase